MSRASLPDSALLQSFSSQTGVTLFEVCRNSKTLLVFLRHFGCTFCREAVADLAQNRAAIAAAGAQLAFVHLGTEERAARFFPYYRLQDVPRFADLDGRLYEAFGLVRAPFRQFLNWESISRMLDQWRYGNFGGLPSGDIQRMPGVFLVQDGRIEKFFRHKLVSDRPDYLSLARAA
jgi:peroxiredoxin